MGTNFHTDQFAKHAKEDAKCLNFIHAKSSVTSVSRANIPSCHQCHIVKPVSAQSFITATQFGPRTSS
eukprot:1238245-Amphidinium_carterae.1